MHSYVTVRGEGGLCGFSCTVTPFLLGAAAGVSGLLGGLRKRGKHGSSIGNGGVTRWVMHGQTAASGAVAQTALAPGRLNLNFSRHCSRSGRSEWRRSGDLDFGFSKPLMEEGYTGEGKALSVGDKFSARSEKNRRQHLISTFSGAAGRDAGLPGPLPISVIVVRTASPRCNGQASRLAFPDTVVTGKRPTFRGVSP